MDLKEYERKRDFLRTPEPRGAKSGEAAVTHASYPRFVIQEHHATSLHWDLRLERDGVLKSWAIPKGIPLRPKLKRLAVQVEDHPLDYINFEGAIPEGNYGAGQVFIWDRGHYAAAEYTENKIELAMLGQRIKGGYKLVRTDGNSWLFFMLE